MQGILHINKSAPKVRRGQVGRLSSFNPYIQDQQEQEQQQERIYQVTDGLKSKYTKITYDVAFNRFLNVAVGNDNLRSLLDTKPSVIESKIIDHVNYLKDIEGLTYRSILVHLSGILHFFEMEDFIDD
jgi:hypothetical protein